jgi:hypothetical protein
MLKMIFVEEQFNLFVPLTGPKRRPCDRLVNYLTRGLLQRIFVDLMMVLSHLPGCLVLIFQMLIFWSGSD